MDTLDASSIKQKMIRTIRVRGPSLPVHIAKETGLSILFTSAFLSELYSEKKVRMSYMRVGSSPIYFMPEHEYRLENFWQYLRSREKDAFILLKEKRILKDSEQEPAIRVALNSIKDFAIPFEKNNELYWKYFNVQESEFEEKPKKIEENEITINKEEIKPALIKEENPLEKIPKEEIITSTEKIQEKKKISSKKIEKRAKKTQIKTRKSKKIEDSFFNKIKEFLLSESIEILDIISFGKNEIILKVKKLEKEEILIALNQRKITENEIIRSYKKILELQLPYNVLITGEPSKKIIELLNAIKELNEIKGIK